MRTMVRLSDGRAGRNVCGSFFLVLRPLSKRVWEFFLVLRPLNETNSR